MFCLVLIYYIHTLAIAKLHIFIMCVDFFFLLFFLIWEAFKILFKGGRGDAPLVPKNLKAGQRFSQGC